LRLTKAADHQASAVVRDGPGFPHPEKGRPLSALRPRRRGWPRRCSRSAVV